jgi:hypothetical protein
VRDQNACLRLKVGSPDSFDIDPIPVSNDLILREGGSARKRRLARAALRQRSASPLQRTAR